ncbi:tripartite tricarboxylate transporter TctB family protein [Marinobacterium lutimaris]|nr:tripartite tricarboxylate transporter TctB family protein [Marinobacterium lutimaris]
MSLLIVDRILAVSFSILCALLIVAGHDMRGGAGVMPVSIAVLGLITSLILIVQKKPSVADEEIPHPINWRRFLLWCALSVIAIAAIQDIGSFIAIPSFLFFSFYLLGKIEVKKSILISLIFTAFIYFTFVQLLEVPLPNGILSDWLDI